MYQNESANLGPGHTLTTPIRGKLRLLLLKANRCLALPIAMISVISAGCKIAGVHAEVSEAVENIKQRNFFQASPLLKSAVQDGSKDAIAAVGVFYLYGLGDLPQSDTQALEWFQKAKDADNPLGENNLAYLYENGRGTTRDLGKAIELYKLASKGGCAAANQNLRRLGVRDSIDLANAEQSTNATINRSLLSVDECYMSKDPSCTDYKPAKDWLEEKFSLPSSFLGSN